MRTENRPQAINRNGFVMPVVILAIVVLGAITVAALATANDEVRSSRAMREAGTALYAAEAGATLLLGTVVDSPRTVLDTLAANMSLGDSVDFGWSTLPNGAAYRAIFYKYGQKSFVLDLTGRDAGPRPSEQSISYALKGGITSINLSAAVSGGTAPAWEDLRLDSANLGGVVLSGLDTMPAQWNPAGCPPMQDLPGTTWGDTSNVEMENGAVVSGTPPIVQDPTNTPLDWGSMDYADLVAMATITLPDGSDLSSIGPMVSSGDCVDDPENWGDPLVPSDPCGGRFPIIHVTGDLDINGGIGQGILLVDGELRVENTFQFYGMIFAQDEIRLEDNVQIYGAIESGDRIRVEDGASVRNSSCAIARAMSAMGGPLEPIGTRSWSALLR